MKNLKRLLFALALMFALVSCSNTERYKNEIARIDSALLSIDTAMTSFQALPVDTLGRLFKKVKEDMNFLQDKYTGDMPRALGVKFSEYRDIPNHIKNFGEVHPQVGAGLDISQKQLNGLKKAIIDGAGTDAAGNSINRSYIEKNTETETKLALDLVQQVKRMESGAQKAFRDYETYYPQLSPVLDSLRTIAQTTP